MKVILLQDVKGQGKKGDLVTVAEGYARNFLLPRNMAVAATEGKIRELSMQKEALDRKRKKEEDEALKIARQIEGIKLHIKAKVGEGGRLFGAISNKDIADRLEVEHGLVVDRKKIALKDPIKTQGEFQVTVKLFSSIQPVITVVVGGE